MECDVNNLCMGYHICHGTGEIVRDVISSKPYKVTDKMLKVDRKRTYRLMSKKWKLTHRFYFSPLFKGYGMEVRIGMIGRY